MHPEDSIVCCLFPQKCNMFHRTPVIIFWDTVWYLNMIVITCLIILVVWSVVCLFIKFQSNICKLFRLHDVANAAAKSDVCAAAAAFSSDCSAATAAEETADDEEVQKEVEMSCISYSGIGVDAACSTESSSCGDTEASCTSGGGVAARISSRGRDPLPVAAAESGARDSSETCVGGWSATKRDGDDDDDDDACTRREESVADAAPEPPSLESCQSTTTTPPSSVGQEHSQSPLKIHSTCSTRNAAASAKRIDSTKTIRDNGNNGSGCCVDARDDETARHVIDTNNSVECEERECCDIDLLDPENKGVMPSGGGGHQYKIQLLVNDQLIPCDEGKELVQKLLPADRKNANRTCLKDATTTNN